MVEGQKGGPTHDGGLGKRFHDLFCYVSNQQSVILSYSSFLEPSVFGTITPNSYWGFTNATDSFRTIKSVCFQIRTTVPRPINGTSF